MVDFLRKTGSFLNSHQIVVTPITWVVGFLTSKWLEERKRKADLEGKHLELLKNEMLKPFLINLQRIILPASNIQMPFLSIVNTPIPKNNASAMEHSIKGYEQKLVPVSDQTFFRNSALYEDFKRNHFREVNRGYEELVALCKG